MAYQYLFPPTTQFQARTGANLTAGYLRVYYTQTDDRAPTYSDFFGTENADDIVLDNDGRAVVIVDDTKTYRLEVYTYNGACLFTIDPLSSIGVGGGSGLGAITKLISTDGTVSITTSSGGGVITYDLSTALSNQASQWSTANALISSINGDGSWEELPVVSTIGTSQYSYGWTASKDTAYDLAASIEMPSGSASAIKMLDVRFDVEVDGVVVKTEYGSIDPSRGMDRVSFEWKGGVNAGQIVNGRLFVRCEEPLTLGLIGNILFNEECDGIIGTGGGGGGGTSYIAGQYIDIAGNVISVTGVQPYGNYVYKSEISARSSMWNTVSAKEDKVNWGLSGNTITSINGHNVNGAGGAVYSAGQYVDIDEHDVISVTGLQPVDGMSAYVEQSAFDDCCSSMSSYVSSLQTDVSGISSVVSAISGATGNYVEKSSISAESSVWNTVSGKQDSGNYLSSTDSALFQPAGSYLSSTDASAFYPSTANPSGYLTGLPSDLVYSADLSAYQPSGNYQTAGDYVQVSSISAESAQWNEVSGLSGKLDNSASSLWYPMDGNPSGFLTEHQELTAYVPFSAVESTPDSAITSIGGSAIKGHEYSGISPIVVDNTADEISVLHSSLVVDSTMTAYTSAGNIVIGVNEDALALSSYVEKSSISANSAVWETVTAKMDASASSLLQPSGNYLSATESSKYYPTSNPSGFITGVDLTPYQLTADMSGYIPTSKSADYYPTSNPSGFVTGVDLSDYATTAYVDSSVSGKLDETAFSTISASFLTSVDLTPYQLTADMSAYAYESSNSAKLDASASSDFYSTSNPSGFITGIDLTDYATTAYVDSSVSSKLDTTAFSDVSASFLTSVDLTPYQLTADMSGYIPTSESANYYPASNPSGFISSVDLSNYATTSYVDSSVSGKLDASAEVVTAIGVAAGALSSINGYGLSAGTANSAGTALYDSAGRTLTSMVTNASASAIAASYAASAVSSVSADYYPTSNPSGFISSVDLSDYATTAYVDSSVSGKLDASASGDFYLTSNPAGYITGVDLSPYQLTADMSAYAFESSNSAKLDASAFSSVSGTFLTAVPAGYATESYVNSAVSGKLDASASSQFITSLPADLATTADVASAVSGKMDQSASGEFYPMTGNPSGFLTAHQSLAGYATEQYVDSSVSGKLDSTAYDSAQFYLTSNPSGFITGVDLTPYQLTADMSGYLQTSESSNYYPTSNPSGFVTGVDLSNYATTAYVDSSVSGKFDSSASGEFYLTSNPSGFITGVDLSNYATTSYVDSSVSGKQDVSAMTAYQPAGTYIYESALGWAEV